MTGLEKADAALTWGPWVGAAVGAWLGWKFVPGHREQAAAAAGAVGYFAARKLVEREIAKGAADAVRGLLGGVG